MTNEITVTISESAEFPGHFSLEDAAVYCGMHASYIRTLVRADKIEGVQRDKRKRIFIAIPALDILKEQKAQRVENARLRAAGELPSYKATYQPAAVSSLKRVRKMVAESDFDPDTKANVDAVLEELFMAKVAEWEAKKAAKAAEEEAEAASSPEGPEPVE